MYTFEDDKETSSRLRKNKSAEHTSALQEATSPPAVDQLSFDTNPLDEEPTHPGLAAASHPGTAVSQHHDLSQQITASMHALTTPGKDAADSQSQSPKAALAALTIACI